MPLNVDLVGGAAVVDLNTPRARAELVSGAAQTELAGEGTAVDLRGPALPAETTLRAPAPPWVVDLE